jgi:hypothetical protein
MIHAIFAVIACCWGYMAVFFGVRFYRRRMPQSLVLAVACLSPVVHVARELHYLARLPTTFFLASALTFGLLGVGIIHHYSAQR